MAFMLLLPFLAVYLALLALYRLYWSLIAHIPGPRLACLTGCGRPPSLSSDDVEDRNSLVAILSPTMNPVFQFHDRCKSVM
ncbi:uncharacterized protein N7498_000465 [Penicillium cinerascens]|uniref:Uncharacterized protein n=1 Tax=Penicillium cinerascens TaxID=70096 RepID=A0A9W9NEE7_9EURO|nr:uncharacterized protein N7498_000465 [Penicillium cinerascens]KAJ5218366.1 hypothetical protein N7498_000465 [Penicillium cinerascens]